MALDQPHRVGQAGEGFGRVRLGGLQESARLGRIAQATPHQDLRQDVTHAELLLQC